MGVFTVSFTTEAHCIINPKFEARSTKWFDKPFDRLTVLSKVEGLTTLSKIEGQIQNPNSQMFKT